MAEISDELKAEIRDMSDWYRDDAEQILCGAAEDMLNAGMPEHDIEKFMKRIISVMTNEYE